MNVRKRGLALLMCICMIFTLLPFSAFADGTSEPDVVYGTYDENGTTWTQKTGLTAVGEPYTNSATGADVTYSKTATPVEGQKDTYNITLKIESKTSSTAPGASAVVLVIDSSGSMKNGRLENAKKVAKSFIDSYGTSGADRYLAVVNFDTYANAFEFGRKNNKTSWLDVSNGTNRQSAKNGFDNLSVGGGTNLEQGLTKAKDLLNASTVKSIANENKFVIVLTDGAPTYYSAEKNGNFITGYYPEGKGNRCDQATYDATVTAATKLKNSANSVYTVCYGAQNEIIDCTKETVSNFLKTKIATSAALAYEASDGYESLKTAFEEIYESIEQGLSSGFTVTDPMGNYVTLDESSITGNGASVKNGTITWTPTTGKVSEENGVKTYTYTLTYKVTLGEVPDDGTYPLNKDTTLAFKDGDADKTLHFNVPGVNGTAPRYNVTYKFDGNYPDSVAVPASEQHKAGDTVTMPEITAPEGWIFNGWKYDSEPVTSVEMPASDITIIGTFTEQKAYTVKYLLNGTDISVKDADTGTKNVGDSVEATAPDLAGYTFAGTDADRNKTITVSSNASENVIIFYYYKNVELVAKDATVVYNGEDQTVTTGYDVVVKADNGKNFKLSGVEFRGVYASGTGKEVGEYDINFVDETVGKIDTTTKYIVANTVKGTLTITPIDTVVVTIKGNTDTKVYNGAERSVTGYTVVSISDTNYKDTDFSLKAGVEAKATGTNASDTAYPMGLTADSFVNNNSNFKNVTFVVEDGSLTITKRTVTLTSETASKTYDGTPLTKPEVTVTGDGFVPGEVTDIKATGSVTNVSEGSVTNTIVYTTTEKFVEGNYNITKAEGKLSITPLAVTVTAKDYTKYVGEKDPAFEATVTGTINNDTVSYTISREKGETAGTYSITPAGAEAQGNYTVTYKAGTLTIKERPYIPPVNPPITDKITVEITGNSDSVVYDGTEHSVKDYTVKISDSRYTEKDFTFSGKALASGINAGAYEMGLKADQFKNTNARFKNVEFVIKADGVLTITQRPLTITAGSAEGIAPVTCDKYTVEGLATGDKVDSVKITGIQSEPGESPNVASDAVIKNAKGEDVTANYKITYVNGVLKAIEVLNKEIHFNYVIGYTDGTIRPNNDISRAEVATIFFRLLTDEAREQYTTTAGNFTDVKAGMWCNRAIATLTNMGIIKGYTDGSFQPNKSITRAELATIIARFAKLDVNTKTFSDINGHWAQKNIELAAGNGWINGYEDGTFRPNNNITRAETFAMINRVLDRQTESVSDLLPTSEMNMWSDNLNENAWYYKDVQEATNYHKCDRVGDSVYEKWTEKVPDIDWASYQI